MASTVTFLASSPHSLTALIESADAVAVSIPRATVLAACSAGPLKALLTRITDWTAFNLNGTRCAEIHVRELINRGVGVGGPNTETAEFFWEAAAIKCNCIAGECQQFEIRLQHSERF